MSDASTVPRTRVYDAVEQLAERGFVRVRESHPKVFTPAPPQRIRRAFYREYVYRLAVAEWGLRAIGPADAGPQWQDVDVEVGADAVGERFLSAIAAVDTHLTFVTVGETTRADILASLAEASERGVAVRLVRVGDPDDDLDEAVPGATVLTVPNTATPPNVPTRLLLADDVLGVLGTWDDAAESPPIGLFSERLGSDVTALLQQVVDTWLADAE